MKAFAVVNAACLMESIVRFVFGLKRVIAHCPVVRIGLALGHMYVLALRGGSVFALAFINKDRSHAS